MSKRQNIAEIIRFAIVGTSNFVIIMLTAWLLGKVLGMNYLAANVVAYALALINNFWWNRVWVFHSRGGNLWHQALLFLLAYAAAYLVQLAVVWLLVRFARLNPSLANFIGLFPFGAVNFILNKCLTFHDKSKNSL